MTARALPLALVSILLAVPLFFGAIAHTFMPHFHPDNAAMADLMHTAVNHAEKQFVAVPLFIALFVFAAAAHRFPGLTTALALSIEERSGFSRYLRRGIAAHRRFA